MAEEHRDESLIEESDRPEFALEPKCFGKWSYEGIECPDMSLTNYCQVKTVRQQVFIPYTAGRYQQRKFKKVQCPIVERLVACIMIAGARSTGKKQNAVQVVQQTFELVHLLTGQNPIQVLINACALGGGAAKRRDVADV